ncbi:hypothetical protein L7F22_008933 [Adiantum nelumboides]|nr:hypothetical protein [Adiantum nelumboides]
MAMVSTKHLFAAAYHVAKEDLAFSKFTSTLDLLEVCGCPYLVRDLYQNDKACSSFICYISKDVLRKILKRLKASRFYSIMIDESTDISCDQHMIVYASFIEDSEPMIVFLGLLEVEEGTSHHLHERATFFLLEIQLERSNMICIGTDGASAMVGRLNAVTTRFKRENPFMTSIRYIAYRASLCLVDVVKGSAYVQLIDQVVNKIASTFSKSSNKSAKLAELEREFGCVVLHMSRIHKVQWLRRALCIHKVCESLEPLLIFLKEHNSTLFDKVCDFQFMYSLHFMADILQRLATLSKIFQSTFVGITVVIGLL